MNMLRDHTDKSVSAGSSADTPLQTQVIRSTGCCVFIRPFILNFVLLSCFFFFLAASSVSQLPEGTNQLCLVESRSVLKFPADRNGYKIPDFSYHGVNIEGHIGTVTYPLLINCNGFKTLGKNHNFALSSITIPVGNLKEGQNFVSYSSNTTHHGIEILWPGPAIMVRYDSIATNQVEDNLEIGSFTNFPNPFSRHTNFQFDLNQPKQVSLALNNLHGELVSTLLKAKLNAGRHVVAFEAKDLSSGMYFARLDTDHKNETLKILVSKQ